MATTYTYIAQNKRRSWILVISFIVLIAVVGWIIGQLTDFGYSGLVIALLVATGMSLFSYFSGDSLALWTAGAHPIAKEDNPSVYRLVENLCITAGLPMPKVYLINDPAINAFATGRDPQHASIAITTGAVDRLENEELEGVIAHELSHIQNYDIRLMTLVAILVGVVALLSNWFFRFSFWGGGRRNSRQAGQLQLIILAIGLVLLIFAPLTAQLIKLAISRKREFLADASSALLTRYPEGLARALEKIEAHNQPLAKANSATAHLYINNPFGSNAFKGLPRLFSTHPPIEERIAALRSM